MESSPIAKTPLRHFSASEMDDVIASFRLPTVTDEEIAQLALRLSESAEHLDHSATARVADVPSTGGPSSLSTLLAPLALVAGGAIVPKVGVPGRPAGGIDVMACIPRFRHKLNVVEIRRCLATCGYAHFLASASFAPLDATFFEHRRTAGAINVPRLAIASLLSKKLAVGVNCVALDVRVAPHCNFGDNWEESRENARRFIRVAGMVGIAATCFLTDAALPYQPFIGRGESIIALHRILCGEADDQLTDHVLLCCEMANACLATSVHNTPSDLRKVFEVHLEQQGTNWDTFAAKVRSVQSEDSAIIEAETAGYSTVDLAGIRNSLVARQEHEGTFTDHFLDPCGVTLVVPSDSPVAKGDPVAKVRSRHGLSDLLGEIRACIRQSSQPSRRRAIEKIAQG